ncbi:aminoglycoside phosphotransferase family protein [Streptomyces sp. NBC_01465]|uniref:aminoglycoside phosphotransferase family protein n=1 Tax=Streptomyces sp. NBC_01465 TaxID=2903878 RepID=UPI002E34DE09|nr:aminoglycoside phosphotransferase family protein [Streptomyces sp. NBC_01465]
MGGPAAAEPCKSIPSGAAGFADLVRNARSHGAKASGYHNQNFLIELEVPTGTGFTPQPSLRAIVREPIRDALPVVFRTWADESLILRAIDPVLPHVPRCLAKHDGVALHSYVEGVPLSSTCPNGKPLDRRLIEALAELLAGLTKVRRDHLPKLPKPWPGEGHSRRFLQNLALRTDEQVRQSNWAEFGGLFTSLGVPENALRDFAERVPAMAFRPFSFLHTDLHRDNIILSYGGEPPLIFIDWELASYGDPLHDLATHLVRMHYPRHQRQEMIAAWADAMKKVRRGAVNGLEADLPRYLEFEYAQSVYPDVMRAARTLGDDIEPFDLEEATQTVSLALGRAQHPLRLQKIPDPRGIESILHRWHKARTRRNHRKQGTVPVMDWLMDPLVPEHDEFPLAAVGEALSAEGAAPAARVFKGTGNLNTVVTVESTGAMVVVRRKMESVHRREPCFLDEHRVLAAIGKAPGVRAPRLLAYGLSEPSDPFAVHTYVGPRDPEGPPRHPVDGLGPLEADDLVDQLAALAGLDTTGLMVPELSGNFYGRLSSTLVDLVRDLPRESSQLASALGLPLADRLGEVLASWNVTARPPVLLHGDLNPWNLVRGETAGQLILIDWEMALIGDPLYDLIRHFHLTPNEAEIRKRMLHRWRRLMDRHGPDYVTNMDRDARVYRSIEAIRSAYVDLDRMVTGASLDAPNVRRAMDSYGMTLSTALANMGLRESPVANRYLAHAFPEGDHTVQGPAAY